MAKEEERQVVFTTELVNDMTDKLNDGVLLKRYQNPWLKGEIGIKRAGVSFKMTKEEQEEYVKCALDVHYFIEKYCKTKREDGSIGEIKLRDYQEEILDNFVDNRYNILMASRQCGKCVNLITSIDCEIMVGDHYQYVKYPLYKLLFIYKTKKNIYDYLKYGIYKLIDILSK